MENPESWNILTSSLAVSQLDKIEETRRFLVEQGLIDPDKATKLVFSKVVNGVLEEGEMTGPSESLRISIQLDSLGVTTDKANKADPWGDIAKSCRD